MKQLITNSLDIFAKASFLPNVGTSIVTTPKGTTLYVVTYDPTAPKNELQTIINEN